MIKMKKQNPLCSSKNYVQSYSDRSLCSMSYSVDVSHPVTYACTFTTLIHVILTSSVSSHIIFSVFFTYIFSFSNTISWICHRRQTEQCIHTTTYLFIRIYYSNVNLCNLKWKKSRKCMYFMYMYLHTSYICVYSLCSKTLVIIIIIFRNLNVVYCVSC